MHSAPAPALKPVGIIILAAAHVPQDIDHLGGPVGIVGGHPFMKDVLQLKWQAKKDIAGTHGAVLGGCLKKVFHLRLIEGWDDGGRHGDDRQARIGKR